MCCLPPSPLPCPCLPSPCPHRSEAHVSVLVPLMLRGFDSPNTRCQEELLRGLHALAADMPYALIKDTLMPRVVGLCLRTTSLVVRWVGV